jgi:hypothetical protein
VLQAQRQGLVINEALKSVDLHARDLHAKAGAGSRAHVLDA